MSVSASGADGASMSRAQQLEGLVHSDAEPLGQHPLRLLDRHPAFERLLELDRPFEQEPGRVGRLPVARRHDRQRAVPPSFAENSCRNEEKCRRLMEKGSTPLGLPD